MTYNVCKFSERSRQSARECRARKKLRYQYLEELVTNREKAVIALHRELEQVGSAPIGVGYHARPVYASA